MSSSDYKRDDTTSMSEEQIKYYTTQFLCLQSDLNGVVPGTVAKEFFEMSKLPNNDLRKIWQLSDVSEVFFHIHMITILCIESKILLILNYRMAVWF